MKISIITSTYNSAATLADTFESVLAQTHQDIEYIVVDGDSKDQTLDIIRTYEPRFEGRMRWISERDNGLYFAMNKGLSMATGDVIGILNSDDFYTDETVLERIVQALEQTGAEAVYGDIHYVAADNLNRCLRYYSSRGFSRWTMRLGFMPAHPSFYCRREVYERHGLFDTRYKVAADFELLLRLIFVGTAAHRMPTCGAACALCATIARHCAATMCARAMPSSACAISTNWARLLSAACTPLRHSLPISRSEPLKNRIARN